MHIAFAFSHWPVSIARYVLEALRAEGHTVTTIGPAWESWIPWTAEGASREGIVLPARYALAPDIELPRGVTVDWPYIESLLSVGPHPEPVEGYLFHSTPPGDPNHYGFHILGTPSGDKPYALLATDPHVLGWWYDGIARDFTHVFNMQRCYITRPTDYWLPYAYSPTHHRRAADTISHLPSAIDVACLGLQYPHRRAVMDAVAADGHAVLSQVGLAFDEYRESYNSAKVAFTWSSKRDTIARVFEAPRMGCALVTNETPDLHYFLKPGRDCLTFTSAHEAIDAIESLLTDQSLRITIANNGYRAIAPHTWNARARSITQVLSNNIPALTHNESLAAEFEARG